jgi:AbrB family looped-hinge helix DNA binding protein
MAVEVVKMTRSGQVTLPAGFRADLGISEGDYLVVEEVGSALVMKKLGPESLRALTKELRKQARKAKITKAMVQEAIREIRK